MKSHFSPEFFAGNRQKLRQLFTGTAPIVITANGLLQKGGDSVYEFSQDANFWYLTGINEPDLILVMDKGNEYLIVPSRSESRETFDGSLNPEVLKKISGIENIYSDTDGWSKLGQRLKKVKHLATVVRLPGYIDSYGFYTNPARARLSRRVKEYNPAIQMLDLTPHLVKMRMVKQAPELAALTEAIDITCQSLKEITSVSKLTKYNYEYVIEAELTRSIRRRGATGHSFLPIVAGGERACTLHNISNNHELDKAGLVIIDTGAEVEHYAADITRTIALSAPSKRQQAIHAAVKEVQDFAFSLLKPGALLKDYEYQIQTFMGEKLRELGLIKSISQDSVREYYPHATSHYIGLNVHDAGDYAKTLEPGMCLTVEPGIYVLSEGIGVRIEDDVLITPKGNKILSNKLSRELKLS